MGGQNIMSGIIGTVSKVKDLYEKKDADISFGDFEGKVLTLKAEREYEIPLFQREIRW